MQAQKPQPRLVRISRDILSELKTQLDGKLFATDFETYGTNWMAPGFWVRCVSFHNDEVSIAVELASTEGVYYPYAYELLDFLADQSGIIAHNAGYEIGCAYGMVGRTPTPHACTYALLALLACEGSPGQSWGLKQAAPELIGWEKWDKDLGNKADLALLPFEQLGWYNQLDSAATWELYKICCETVDKHKAAGEMWAQIFWDYYREDFTDALMLQDEAYREGLYIDPPYVAEYLQQVEQEVDDTRRAFLEHPDIAPHIAAYDKAVVEEAERALRDYGKKYKLDGSETVNYQKAQIKVANLRGVGHFNLGSPAQLKWLFYDRLKCDVKIYTDTGAPSTDADALAAIPVYGKLLLNHRDVISQQKFLLALLDNEENGVVRISIRLPGTITGRASAGSLEGN